MIPFSQEILHSCALPEKPDPAQFLRSYPPPLTHLVVHMIKCEAYHDHQMLISNTLGVIYSLTSYYNTQFNDTLTLQRISHGPNSLHHLWNLVSRISFAKGSKLDAYRSQSVMSLTVNMNPFFNISNSIKWEKMYILRFKVTHWGTLDDSLEFQ